MPGRLYLWFAAQYADAGFMAATQVGPRCSARARLPRHRGLAVVAKAWNSRLRFDLHRRPNRVYLPSAAGEFIARRRRPWDQACRGSRKRRRKPEQQAQAGWRQRRWSIAHCCQVQVLVPTPCVPRRLSAITITAPQAHVGGGVMPSAVHHCSSSGNAADQGGQAPLAFLRAFIFRRWSS